MSKEYRLSIIVTGKDSGASSMLTGIGGSLRSIGTIAGGILTSQIFLGIANQIGQMFTSAVAVTAQMQTMQMMLTNLQARELIRSGDFEDMNAALRAAAPLAEATMDQLERIATLSPYQLENVANTYKMAMAFGFTAKESTVFTDALLNMAAGVGANGEMLDRMAYNLAQVRMQGKVTAMDIRQLAMAGFDLVDVLKYTGKQMGLNIKDHLDFNAALEQGKISWADFTKYFAEYADKNFGGASERMSRTLEGLKSTFKDVFMLTMPKLLGPAADVITGYLNDILNRFLAFSDSGKLEQVGVEIGNVVSNIMTTLGLLDSEFAKEREWEAPKFSIEDFIIDGTEAFKNWAKDVDWDEVSNEIKSGIEEIDWEGIGETINISGGNIFDGLAEIAQWDFEPILRSTFEGLGNMLLTAFGSELSMADVDAIVLEWTTNAGNSLSFGAAGLGTMLSTSFIESLSNFKTDVSAKMWEVVFEIENILYNLKEAFRGKFDDMIDSAKSVLENRAIEIWQAVAELIDLAKSALQPLNIEVSEPDYEGIKTRVSEKITEIYQAGKTAIKPFFLTVVQPAWEWLSTLVAEKADALYQAGKKALKAISVIVGLPDWDALAREIEEGMAILNAAMKGGVSSGVKGTNKFAAKAKAAGGPVQAGETYLVGERGRELFVPDRNGYIVPNHKVEGMGGALMPSHAGAGGSVVVVNFYYQPPISLGNEREARQNIAPMVAEAVRGEFQKRGI